MRNLRRLYICPGFAVFLEINPICHTVGVGFMGKHVLKWDFFCFVLVLLWNVTFFFIQHFKNTKIMLYYYHQ